MEEKGKLSLPLHPYSIPEKREKERCHLLRLSIFVLFFRSVLYWLILVHYGSFCYIRKSLGNLWARKGRKGTNGKLGFPLSSFLRFQERSKREKIKNGDASRSERRARPWYHFGFRFLLIWLILAYVGSFWLIFGPYCLPYFILAHFLSGEAKLGAWK